jgi:hypothetical protein
VIRGRECASYIFPPFATHQFRLGLRVTRALEGVRSPRSIQNARDAACDWIDMVEASLAYATPMDGDTHDEIGSLPGFVSDPTGQFGRKMLDREADRDRRAKRTLCGFEAGYPSPNGTLVANERTADMQSAAFCKATAAALGHISMHVMSDRW